MTPAIAATLAAGAEPLLAGVALKWAEQKAARWVDDTHTPLHQEDPMSDESTKLTADERNALVAHLWGEVIKADASYLADLIAPTIERIIVARVAEALKRIVWLPDAWERGSHRSAEDCANDLRAALTALEDA